MESSWSRDWTCVPLRWQVDSLPLDHQGSPVYTFQWIVICNASSLWDQQLSISCLCSLLSLTLCKYSINAWMNELVSLCAGMNMDQCCDRSAWTTQKCTGADDAVAPLVGGKTPPNNQKTVCPTWTWDVIIGKWCSVFFVIPDLKTRMAIREVQVFIGEGTLKVVMEEAKEGRWKRSRCQLYNAS